MMLGGDNLQILLALPGHMAPYYGDNLILPKVLIVK